MRAVNLLPRDDGRQGPSKNTLLTVVTAASGIVFVSAVLGALTIVEGGKLAQAKEELLQVEAQLAAVPAAPRPRPEIEVKLGTEQTARVTALSTALARRVAWDRILREISLTLPDDISLQVLKTKSPVSGATQDPAAPSTPATLATGLQLEGTTFSHASVARLLSRLQVIPDLTNVQLVDSTRPAQGPSVVKFKIAADVRLPGAA
jgi:Tfp pilus assembly protein PilN